MQIKDAANLLNLSGVLDKTIIKAAYRAAAQKYHPDRNPAGLEVMKMINEAYEVLKDYSGDIGDDGVDTSGHGYPDAVNDAIAAIIELNDLTIEVCGAWVWVSGDTYSHKKALKEAAFRYASKKKRWYFRPSDWQSSSRGGYSMDDIRDKYGSDAPTRSKRKSLASA